MSSLYELSRLDQQQLFERVVGALPALNIGGHEITQDNTSEANRLLTSTYVKSHRVIYTYLKRDQGPAWVVAEDGSVVNKRPSDMFDILLFSAIARRCNETMHGDLSKLSDATEFSAVSWIGRLSSNDLLKIDVPELLLQHNPQPLSQDQ